MSIDEFTTDVKSVCMENDVCFTDVLNVLTFIDGDEMHNEFGKCKYGNKCRFRHLRKHTWRYFNKNTLKKYLVERGWSKKIPNSDLTSYSAVDSSSDSDELPELIPKAENKADESYCLIFVTVAVLMLPIAYHFVKHANDLCFYPGY